MDFSSLNERLSWTQAFISGLPYAATSGMTILEADVGRTSVLLPARPVWTGDTHTQLIHPGCLSALADTACGVAVGCALTALEPFATLDLRMDYLRPPKAEVDLVCRAECHRLSRSVAFVRGELTQPGQSEVIATVNAAFMRATAHSPRRDSGAAPAPSLASAPAGAPRWASTPAPGPEVPALPAGRSPYVDFMGIHQQAQLDAGPVFRLPFDPRLIGNPVLPALHGGVLAGFGETAMILHLIATNPGIAGVPRGVDFDIAYLRSAKPVDTFAQSTTVRQGNRVALVQVSVWQDDPHKPVAQARAHFLMPQDTA